MTTTSARQSSSSRDHAMLELVLQAKGPRELCLSRQSIIVKCVSSAEPAPGCLSWMCEGSMPPPAASCGRRAAGLPFQLKSLASMLPRIGTVGSRTGGLSKALNKRRFLSRRLSRTRSHFESYVWCSHFMLIFRVSLCTPQLGLYT